MQSRRITDEYFTVNQAAEYMNVSRQAMSRWIREDKFQVQKIGREVLIRKEDLPTLRCPFCHQLITAKGVKT